MDSTMAGTALARAPGRRRIWICLAVLLLGASLPVVPASPTPPGRASISINQGKGFDTCNTSIENLQAFRSNTPYYNVGIYLGGASYGCPRARDAAYMKQ